MVVYLNQATEMQVMRPIVIQQNSPGYTTIIQRNQNTNEDIVVTGITVLNNTANVCTFDIYFRDGTTDIYLMKNMEINNYETKNPITEQTPIYLPNGSGFDGVRFNTSSNPCDFTVMVNWYSVTQ